ncbi:DUF1320 domain-containing protein [Shewanella yunxiaonensis]|uniref:DUF1320 domain-containing protein n=1 Tax=Shewanella yunxiaonensis TaxID=2829809 RepID=A0ABX7YUK1_9GAMM|nr:phage protein Gp36 family protein [Shewanella yunxiaonensis]QUN06433.1 DUF1320 domain-containing protein [Shewanella yunxiaonensis]
MDYATLADMVNRFGEDELISLTDRSNTGSVDSTVLDSALADAAATIEGYIAAKYPLPLATVPGVLNRICCDLTRYYLYDERATDQVTKRHDDAIKLLTQLSTGTVTLGLPETDIPQSSDTAEMQSAGSIWARGNSGGFL